MSGSWTRYYEAAGSEPRDTLLFALERFDGENVTGLAVDLGCGTGRDTVELLRRGWRVLAVDSEPRALERLEAQVGPHTRLSTQCASFEHADWPRAELVNASFSLPFCPPTAFPSLWERIEGSLVAGGRFCGQLFGHRDDWARGGASESKGEIAFHTRLEVERLVRRLVIERLDEVEEDGETAVGDRKHWHLFHLVLRKP